MTPPPRRPTAAVLPLRTDLSLHAGRVRSGWCSACKAWTHLTADLLLLAPEGVSTIGTWEWCEICDDPDEPLPARRIDRV
ncbi:hypothetical protein [Streptomyces sp. NBC_00120]|uniref:hypothetical protein n=1 Tax=Streptomyces sp. NBC_00120 TaxID=2975660 RepID=UPI00225ADEB0|nr:hypothetical protein [Streptomyces sp. NBC_00120]MCX5326287.1 hypothetical protein [Streptomyces sp. NBC_00120]